MPLCFNSHHIEIVGTSLVAQWLRILLAMQGVQVQALVQEYPTCRGATKPVCHNYWARATATEVFVSRACAPQQEKPLQWEARVTQWWVAATHRKYRKPVHSNEDPTQPKINKLNKQIYLKNFRHAVWVYMFIYVCVK